MSPPRTDASTTKWCLFELLHQSVGRYVWGFGLTQVILEKLPFKRCVWVSVVAQICQNAARSLHIATHLLNVVSHICIRYRRGHRGLQLIRYVQGRLPAGSE